MGMISSIPGSIVMSSHGYYCTKQGSSTINQPSTPVDIESDIAVRPDLSISSGTGIEQNKPDNADLMSYQVDRTSDMSPIDLYRCLQDLTGD